MSPLGRFPLTIAMLFLFFYTICNAEYPEHTSTPLPLFSLFAVATDRIVYTLDTETTVVELVPDPSEPIFELDSLLGQAAARLEELSSSLPAALSQFSLCEAYRAASQSLTRTIFRKDARDDSQFDWSSSSVVLPPGHSSTPPLEFLSVRAPLEDALLELAELLPRSESHFFISATDGATRVLPGTSVIHYTSSNAFRSALASQDARFLPSFRAHLEFGRVLLLVDGSTYYTDNERKLIRTLASMVLRVLAPSNFVKLMFASRAILPFSDSFLWLDRYQEEMVSFIEAFDFDARDLGRCMSTSSLSKALDYGLSRDMSSPDVNLAIVISSGAYFDAFVSGDDRPAALDTNLVFLQLPIQSGLELGDASSASSMASRAAELVANYGGTYVQLEAGQDASFFDFVTRNEGRHPMRTPGDIDCFLESSCDDDPYCIAPGFSSPANDLPRLPTGVESRDLVAYLSIIIDAISPFMTTSCVRYTHSRGSWASDEASLVVSIPVYARIRFRRLSFVGVLATVVRPSPVLFQTSQMSQMSTVLFHDDELAIWPEPSYCAAVNLSAENGRLDSRGHYSLLRLNAAVGRAVRLFRTLSGASFRALVQQEGGLCSSTETLAVRAVTLPFDSRLSLALVTSLGDSLLVSLPDPPAEELTGLYLSEPYLPGGVDEAAARPGMLFFRVTESVSLGRPDPGISGQCSVLAWAENVTCLGIPHCPCPVTGWEPRNDSPTLALGFYSLLSVITKGLASLGPAQGTGGSEELPQWGMLVRASALGLSLATYPIPEAHDPPSGATCYILAGPSQAAPNGDTVSAMQNSPSQCYVGFPTDVSIPYQGVEVPILTSTLVVRLDILKGQLGSPDDGKCLILLSESGVVLANVCGPNSTLTQDVTGYTLLNHEDLVPLSLVLHAASALTLTPHLTVSFSALAPGKQRLPSGLRGELVLLEVVEGAALFSSTLSGNVVQPLSFSAGHQQGEGDSVASLTQLDDIVVPSTRGNTVPLSPSLPTRSSQLYDYLSLRRTQYTPSVLRQVFLGRRGLAPIDYGVFFIAGLLIVALFVYLIARLRPECVREKQVHKTRYKTAQESEDATASEISAPRPASAPAGTP